MNFQIFTMRVAVFILILFKNSRLHLVGGIGNFKSNRYKLLSGKKLQRKQEFSYMDPACKRKKTAYFFEKKLVSAFKLILQACKPNTIFMTEGRNGARCILLITGMLFCQGCFFPPSGEFPIQPALKNRADIELSSNEKTLKGKGRIVFDQPLFSLKSKELYLLTADFFHSNSSLILHSHFSDFSKQDGVKVFFEKEDEDLILSASTPGHLKQGLGAIPDYFLKNLRLSLYIEVENGIEDFVGIQIWDFYINPKGRLKSPAPFLSRQNRKASSSDMIFYSRGEGILWGLELNEVRLIQAVRKSPKNP